MMNKIPKGFIGYKFEKIRGGDAIIRSTYIKKELQKYKGYDAIARNTYSTLNISNRVDKRYFIRVLNNNFDCPVS